MSDVKRNAIGYAKMRQLEGRIVADWPTIEANRPVQPAYCKQVGEALGFLVTTGNLANVLKIIGKDWPNPKRVSNGKPKPSKPGAPDWVARRAIVEIYRRLGERLPAEFETAMEAQAALTTAATDAAKIK